MFHMLANMISFEVYPELSTVEMALDLKPPKNGPSFRVIAPTKGLIETPIFPAWSSCGLINDMKAPSSWGTQASDWAVRAGLAEGLGLHAVRREALIKANGKNQAIWQ